MGHVIEACDCGESMETIVPDGQEPIVIANWLAQHTGHQRLNPIGEPIDAQGHKVPHASSATVPEQGAAAAAVLADTPAAAIAADQAITTNPARNPVKRGTAPPIKRGKRV